MSELGKKLREARIEKGYTLNSLQQITKIQKKYLEGIEEGNYSEMPGAFNVRSFIKQYADVVGLSSTELLELFEQEVAHVEQVGEGLVIESVNTTPSRLERAREVQSKSKIDQFLRIVPFLFLAGVVLVVIVALVFAIQQVSKSERQAELAKSESESIALVASVSPEAAANFESSVSNVNTEELNEGEIRTGFEKIRLTSSNSEETTYELLSSADKYTFEIRGNSYVWVGIAEDDQFIVDTTIDSGEVQTYTISPGVTKFRIRVGYPQGADIYVNGTKVEIKSDYFIDSIIFHASKPSTASATTENSSVEGEQMSEGEAEDTNETQEYQGPAALDPSRTSSGE